MARKPSERRNYKEDVQELNLTPMMNLVGILIPALLVSAAFIEIAVVNVAAPSISDAPPPQEPPKDDKPPLNLTVTVTDKGYIVAASGAVLPGPQPNGPTFPIQQKTVSCSRYRDGWPPPREKNRGSAKCPKESGSGESQQSFWVYDTEALRKKLIDIKESFPDEHRIIIAAEPDVEYEAIVDVMDTAREVKDEQGEIQTLFDEVVLSPGTT